MHRNKYLAVWALLLLLLLPPCAAYGRDETGAPALRQTLETPQTPLEKEISAGPEMKSQVWEITAIILLLGILPVFMIGGAYVILLRISKKTRKNPIFPGQTGKEPPAERETSRPAENPQPTKLCPFCFHTINSYAKFCELCGYAFPSFTENGLPEEKRCKACGSRLQDKICTQCGYEDNGHFEENALKICPLCGIPFKPRSKICTRCGLSLH